MKTFDFDWTTFLDLASTWEMLPMPCREYFLFRCESNRRMALRDINVDVTPLLDEGFLEYAASPAAEAALSRFAERVGHHVGTVFRLTRVSIFESFRAGLTADIALSAMSDISRKSIPSNVEKQIRDWFAQCRNVRVSNAVLVRCPDKETAMKVCSFGGRKVRPLSETVLEIPESYRRTLERKLRDSGIAVSRT